MTGFFLMVETFPAPGVPGSEVLIPRGRGGGGGGRGGGGGGGGQAEVDTPESARGG